MDAIDFTRPATVRRFDKAAPDDLALFGGRPAFDRPLSTSNLVRPRFEAFMNYSKIFIHERRYTNDGPLVRLLESRLAAWHGVAHCVAMSGGFWAVALALKALALPGRRHVVMPSLTYRKLADIAYWAGLVPSYCEVDPASLAMTAATVEPLIDGDTAAILGIHPIVNRCPVGELVDVARRHRLPIVFDSVESVGETWNRQPIGAFGDAECFSMHASKLINGFEGGYVTTNDGDLARHLAVVRGFGFRGQDNAEAFGINTKLNEVHAAMALACLDEVGEQLERNRERYLHFKRRLAGVPGVRLLEFDESERCTYKNVVVELLDDWPLARTDTIALLHAERAIARPYYAPALHTVKTDAAPPKAPLDGTERLAQRFLLLPCGEAVGAAEVDVLGDLLAFLQRHGAAIRERQAGATASGRAPS